MKQYTTPNQTAKLIELGFEKPKSIEVYRDGHCVPFVEQRWDYSIGELIEMLPKTIKHLQNQSLVFYLAVSFLQSEQWYIDYETCDSALISVCCTELIDGLYDMIIKLKEKGAI